VSAKVDLKSIDAIVFSNSEEIEKVIQSYEVKFVHDTKVHTTTLTEVRAQLEDIKNFQMEQDTKIASTMRFIDWFMSVRPQ
jgi:hypothetical protein